MGEGWDEGGGPDRSVRDASKQRAMTTFLLIRHAATDLLGRTLAGRAPGVHLNMEGEAQAQRLAQRLASAALTAVYASPLERALETAAPIGRRHGLEVVASHALMELDFGAWTGCTFDELSDQPQWRLFNTFRSGTRPPDGELMIEGQARIVAELTRLREHHPNGPVAIVSHADMIKAAVAHYLGVHLDLFHRIEISPASVTTVALHEWGPQVLQLNGTGEVCG